MKPIAWRVDWRGNPGIVAAETRAKAITRAMNQILDTYDRRDVKWVDFKARRAPEYDGWPELNRGSAWWDEDYLKITRANEAAKA